jgi:hypothetical protein
LKAISAFPANRVSVLRVLAEVRTTQNRAHKCARESIAHIHFALLRNIEHICVRLPSFTMRLCARSALACSAAREFHLFFAEALLGRLP